MINIFTTMTEYVDHVSLLCSFGFVCQNGPYILRSNRKRSVENYLNKYNLNYSVFKSLSDKKFVFTVEMIHKWCKEEEN